MVRRFRRARASRRWCSRPGLGLLAGWLVATWPGSSEADEAEEAEVAEHVGPLLVSTDGRARVRGGRPSGGSIFVAWQPGVEDPESQNRRALAEFERAAFPPGARWTTIARTPPEPWMAGLQRPDLPVRWNLKTVEYLRFFRTDDRGQAMMRAWMKRAGRYEARLRTILAEVAIPEDLVFVALAESGFNPRVRSRVGAAGLWQFMKATGNVYGLEQSYWVDERFHIEKSTYAAALYLRDLKARFGSWELALAAYNAGYGLVMTSIKRHNTNNFWALAELESGLPYATTNYVPKIIAAALVGRNRAVFGCDPDSLAVDAPMQWVEVEVERSTPLERIARILDEDPELIAELNAHLIRGRTPPRRDAYPIKIPEPKLARWKQAKGSLQSHWRNESTYTVREGERLAAIAQRVGIREHALRRLNGVRDSAEVAGGITLVVPSNVERGPPPEADEPRPLPLAAVPVVSPTADHRLVFFQTTRASTPRTISRAFGIPWQDIVRWNDLDPQARLQAGQVLQLVVPESFAPEDAGVVVLERSEVQYVVRGSREHLEAQLDRRDLLRRGYRVRRGDTLRRIGRRFDLSVGDLARINRFSRRYDPLPGETIVVYVPRARKRGTTEAPAPKRVYFAEGPTREATPVRSPSNAESSRVPGQGNHRGRGRIRDRRKRDHSKRTHDRDRRRRGRKARVPSGPGSTRLPGR